MRRTWTVFLLGLAACACGGRADYWDSVPKNIQTVGLSGSVAVLDPAGHRLLMLTSPRGFELATTVLSVGTNPSIVQTDRLHERLFVLSKGIQPRRNVGDEWPSLTLVDGGTAPKVIASYSLTQTSPPTDLALDAQGEWAVLYQSAASAQAASTAGLLTNPNELILLPLPPSDAVAPVNTEQDSYRARKVTLTDTASQPRELMFTPNLEIGGETHRLLVVLTTNEIVLVDLNDPDLSKQTTIPVPERTVGQPGSPAQVVFPQSADATSTQALMAVRLQNDSDVVLYQLTLADGLVTPTQNATDVGGVPTDIAFVRTTTGQLMLAAAVPQATGSGGVPLATLVDPATTTTQRIQLGAAYKYIEIVTQEVADASATVADKALLWSDSTLSVGFWSLGVPAGALFRSVESYQLGFRPTAVYSVLRDHTDPDPGQDYSHLKLLEAGQQKKFYIVNLRTPQSPPINVSQAEFSLVLAPDGQRAWAYSASSAELGVIDFATLHPTSLTLERPVTGAFDIAQSGAPVQVAGASTTEPPRAMVALHLTQSGAHAELGATILDVRAPDAARTRFYSGLLFGGSP